MVTDLSQGQTRAGAYKIAWGVALLFYFVEYAARSAPAVMVPELSTSLGIDAVGVSGVVGSYYYTYAAASLLAGAALDYLGAKIPVGLGAAFLGLGCMLFIAPIPAVAELGRLLQGFGSAFAFTGATFLAARGFSGAVLATVTGVTQCLGMLGGSAGQLAVGPLIHGTMGWRVIWGIFAVACVAMALSLWEVTPREMATSAGSAKRLGVTAPFKIVLSNPQSYLCGLVAGLLFVPTTVGSMIWGVAFYQQDRAFGYEQAVTAAAMVPLGWAIGCPLFGWLADALPRRKLALAIGQGVMLGSIALAGTSATHVVSYLAMLIAGIGSGAAMIPYTIIREVNPDRVKGSAVGVINFLTFGITAVIGPIFAKLVGSNLASNTDHAAHFREAAWFWGAIVLLSVCATLFLRETGRGRVSGTQQRSLA